MVPNLRSRSTEVPEFTVSMSLDQKARMQISASEPVPNPTDFATRFQSISDALP